MKIIFAQGNPGDQYTATRHNVGFMVLDAYAKEQKASFLPKPKFFANIAEYKSEDEKILLVKPTTFYNDTGKSLRSLVDFYKLTPATEVLVIHDDLALPFGTLRTREKGSDAGNNGIKSLNAHLGHEYARLRVGIYNDLRDRLDDADFVLSRFTKEEHDIFTETIIPKVCTILDSFTAGTFETTTHN